MRALTACDDTSSVRFTRPAIRSRAAFTSSSVIILPLTFAQVADQNIFEAHVAMSAGVELQSDAAVGAERFGIGVVNHLDAVQARDVAISFHLQQVFVPVVRT